MSFVDERPNKSGKTEYRKTEYIKLVEGMNKVRIVQSKARLYWTHFIAPFYVECLGQENCPVCKSNKKMQIEFPEEYQRQQGYVPARRRFYVNVIDRSMGKICPQCHTEFKGSVPVHCPNCDYPINDVPLAPLNKIKVLAGGPTLFEDNLNAIDKAILDPKTNEPVGITNYDITLMVKGSGKERVITPIPDAPSELDFDYTTLEMFDLDKVVVKIEADEIASLQKGVALKDIFAARKASKSADNGGMATFISPVDAASIKEQMTKLFQTEE
jgi:hypothetical protein